MSLQDTPRTVWKIPFNLSACLRHSFPENILPEVKDAGKVFLALFSHSPPLMMIRASYVAADLEIKIQENKNGTQNLSRFMESGASLSVIVNYMYFYHAMINLNEVGMRLRKSIWMILERGCGNHFFRTHAVFFTPCIICLFHVKFFMLFISVYMSLILNNLFVSILHVLYQNWIVKLWFISHYVRIDWIIMSWMNSFPCSLQPTVL